MRKAQKIAEISSKEYTAAGCWQRATRSLRKYLCSRNWRCRLRPRNEGEAFDNRFFAWKYSPIFLWQHTVPKQEKIKSEQIRKRAKCSDFLSYLSDIVRRSVCSFAAQRLIKRRTFSISPRTYRSTDKSDAKVILCVNSGSAEISSADRLTVSHLTRINEMRNGLLTVKYFISSAYSGI